MGKVKERGNGEGTIYKSSKTGLYIGQYTINYKRHSVYQRKNEKIGDFKKRFNAILNSINQGTYIEKANDTVLSIAKNYIKQKHIDGLISDRTYNRNKETVTQLEKTCNSFCNKPIQKVTITDIEKSKEDMRIYSNSTIQKIWSILNKVFKIAYSRRIINFNIMEDETLNKPISKKEQKKVQALTVKEEAFLEKFLLNTEHPYNPILLLQLYTGMRIGEVLALSKEYVDLKNNTLTICRTITRDKNDKVILSEHTKTYNKKTGVDSGKRTIPLSQKARKVLQKEMKRNISNIYNLIFWDYNNGTFITDGEVNSYLNRVNQKEKITDHLHSHKLRHTFITRCQEKGMPLAIIQALVGHVKGSSITNSVYTTVSLDFMKQELEKIN